MPFTFMATPDGSRVRELRRGKEWTQTELARRAHLSRQTIWKVETGQPRSKTVIGQVARALGVKPDKITLQAGSAEGDEAEPLRAAS
jgi:transcriptional regulator with XRE-family HTH domain